MKIVRLQAENIKRIKAVEVVPDGTELVVVGGKNDAGKSSLLDAIEMAMSGESATPPTPVRKGQKAAKIVLDLGDLVVTRTYTPEGGRKLVVANKEGARFPSPQAMLDRLYGDLSFDPLAFERLDPKAQAETLRSLVGLDLSALDGKRAKLYDDRTLANREVRALEIKLESSEEYADAPAEEVSIAALAAELAEAEKKRKAVGPLEAKVSALERKRDVFAERKQAAAIELVSIEKRLGELRAAIEESVADAERLSDELAIACADVADALAAVPAQEPIRAKLEAAEETNLKVRTNRQHAQAKTALEDARAFAKGLSDQIDGIDAEKSAKLAATTFPVDGLGVDGDGVVLNGLPFEQASTSDRLRTSVAIGLAANPTLKVLLVRDGSLLGCEKLALLGEMAKAAGAQVWLEMLQESPDGLTTVFIEDGSVVRSSKAVAEERIAT